MAKMSRGMAKMRTIEAKLDGKGLGNAVNALASQGTIRPVVGLLHHPNGDREALRFNSAWALTDWKAERGYYGPRAEDLPTVEFVVLAEEAEPSAAVASPPERALAEA